MHNHNTFHKFASLSTEELFALQDDIATDKKSILIWQDLQFIGFVKMNGDSFEIQPEGPRELDFTLFRDIRMIGKEGEWHLWSQPGGEIMGRLRLQDKLHDDEVLTDQHYLWGTDTCPHEENQVSGWSCVTEERGMRIWLPWAHDASLPAKLPVWHIIDRDENGLAAIVDSMFLLPE
jgi:CRISPR-associated protein (TIGR03984 family)